RRLRRIEAKLRRECPYQDTYSDGMGDIYTAAAGDSWVNDHIDVVAGIRALPRRQSEVIALHFLAEYTLDEVAEILGISLSSAKTHKRRALESLRKGAGSLPSYTGSEMEETG